MELKAIPRKFAQPNDARTSVPTQDISRLGLDLICSSSSSSSLYVRPVSDKWSNVDLFQRYNEASKDCTVDEEQKCSIVIDDSDSEFNDLLEHEDFQRFSSDLSVLRSDQQSISKGSNSGTSPCQIVGKVSDSDYSMAPPNRVSMGRKTAEKFSIHTTPVSGKVGHRASSEVAMAQSIAKSRLRDFDMSGGYSKSSLFPKESLQRSCYTPSQQLLQNSDQKSASSVRPKDLLQETADTRMNFDLLSDYCFNDVNLSDGDQDMFDSVQEPSSVTASSLQQVTAEELNEKPRGVFTNPWSSDTNFFATPSRRNDNVPLQSSTTQDLSNVFSGIF